MRADDNGNVNLRITGSPCQVMVFTPKSFFLQFTKVKIRENSCYSANLCKKHFWLEWKQKSEIWKPVLLRINSKSFFGFRLQTARTFLHTWRTLFTGLVEFAIPFYFFYFGFSSQIVTSKLRQARGKSAKEADLPWEENILHPNRAEKNPKQKQNIRLQTNETTQQFERQQIKVFLFHHTTVGSDSQIKVVKQ